MHECMQRRSPKFGKPHGSSSSAPFAMGADEDIAAGAATERKGNPSGPASAGAHGADPSFDCPSRTWPGNDPVLNQHNISPRTRPPGEMPQSRRRERPHAHVRNPHGVIACVGRMHAFCTHFARNCALLAIAVLARPTTASGALLSSTHCRAAQPRLSTEAHASSPLSRYMEHNHACLARQKRISSSYDASCNQQIRARATARAHHRPSVSHGARARTARATG